MSDKSVPKTQPGFHTIQIKIVEEATCYRELYIREHKTKGYDEQKPHGRTLFVSNIPPYATEEKLTRIFSKAAGKVRSVILPSKPGFKDGYIVFENDSSIQKCLKVTRLKPFFDQDEPRGLTKYMLEYNKSILNREEVEKELEKFASEHATMEEEKKKAAEATDAEGWTTVTKKSRRPGLALKQSVQDKLIQKTKKKSLKKYLKNFYKFQKREENVKNIVELQKGFDEKKKKIQEMRKMRIFKPL